MFINAIESGNKPLLLITNFATLIQKSTAFSAPATVLPAEVSIATPVCLAGDTELP